MIMHVYTHPRKKNKRHQQIVETGKLLRQVPNQNYFLGSKAVGFSGVFCIPISLTLRERCNQLISEPTLDRIFFG